MEKTRFNELTQSELLLLSDLIYYSRNNELKFYENKNVIELIIELNEQIKINNLKIKK